MGDLIKEGVVETCNCGKSGICGWHSTDTECIVYGSDQIARLWECIGRWAAMIAHDGEDANLTPPAWFVDAVKAATAPPKREWVGLTGLEQKELMAMNSRYAVFETEAKLKEKNT